MVKKSELLNLFSSVKRILAHQEQIERLKGEKFNIFSVLRMERSENGTHSALLAELLNPSGSHLKGPVFLKLFLKSLQLENYLSIESTLVTTEYFIGEINDADKSGGRLDILIRDGNNVTISIENKIYAGDQQTQIERYCNYNAKKNKVFYLTLLRNEPSIESKGDLVSGQDFHLLSYRDDIRNWLEQCLKEAADAPLLRETIKQYINLIKKMTSTADNQHETELIELLMNNYEAAAFVTNTLVKARHRIADGIRYAVFEKLRTALPLGIQAAIGSNIDHRYAQIWIWHKSFENASLYFGVESFNGTGNNGGNLYVGIYNKGGTANDYTKAFGTDPPKYWYEELFLSFDGAHINFGNNNLIINIHQSNDYAQKLIEHITSCVVVYVASREQKILEALKAMNDYNPKS